MSANQEMHGRHTMAMQGKILRCIALTVHSLSLTLLNRLAFPIPAISTLLICFYQASPGFQSYSGLPFSLLCTSIIQDGQDACSY